MIFLQSNFKELFILMTLFALTMPLASTYLAEVGSRSVGSSQLGSSIALVGSSTLHLHPLSNLIDLEGIFSTSQGAHPLLTHLWLHYSMRQILMIPTQQYFLDLNCYLTHFKVLELTLIHTGQSIVIRIIAIHHLCFLK